MTKNRKLIWRIYPSFLLIIVVSLISVTGYTSNSIRKFFLNQSEKDLKTQAFLIEDKVSALLSPLDPKAIKELCNSLGKAVVTRITVILPDGKVVGDSDENPDFMDNHKNRPEISEALKGGVGSSIRYSGTLSQNMMYVAIPVKSGDNIDAVIRTSVPITSIEDELNAILKERLFWGILTALLASILALILSRRITRPVEEMRIGAEHYARGDLNYYLPIPDTLELASLAESMNDMASQLENRIKTIVNQRNEYEAVLSSMIEGVIAVDTQERILSINQAAMEMLAIDSVNLKHQSIQEMIRNSELQKQVAVTLSKKAPLEQDITVHHDSDRVLNLKSLPLFNADNLNIGALLVLNDVTRLRLLEDIRKDFVANVSHELKTPLTTIKGFVETLINGSLTENPDESLRFMKIISRHVDRLNAIIEDLLSLARIEKLDEKIETRLEQKEIRNVIETAIQLLQSKADEKNISLELDCDAELKVKIDRTLLEQAIVNLLDNAVKYSNESSQVRIEVGTDHAEMFISIHDQGPGIHKKHLPRLFERFYRADKARSRELGGTGLGLAIVKHIAQLHSGRVSVHTVQGKGSTFSIHLPNA